MERTWLFSLLIGFRSGGALWARLQAGQGASVRAKLAVPATGLGVTIPERPDCSFERWCGAADEHVAFVCSSWTSVLPVVRARVGLSGLASAPGGGPEVACRCVRGQPAPVLEIVGGHWVGFSSGQAGFRDLLAARCQETRHLQKQHLHEAASCAAS